MPNVKIQIGAAPVSAFIAYAMTAFCLWNPHPSTWDMEHRADTVFVAVIIFLFRNLYKHESTKQDPDAK